MKRNGDKGLPRKIVAACAAIDAAAAAARGDDILRLAKAAEHIDLIFNFRDAIPATVDPARWPFLAAESASTGEAPAVVVVRWKQAWLAWTQHVVRVEGMREQAKAQARRAKHPDELVGAQAVTWPKLV